MAARPPPRGLSQPGTRVCRDADCLLPRDRLYFRQVMHDGGTTPGAAGRICRLTFTFPLFIPADVAYIHLTGDEVLGNEPQRRRHGAGWSSPVARQAHNLKVTGSNPVPATKSNPSDQPFRLGPAGFFCLGADGSDGLIERLAE